MRLPQPENDPNRHGAAEHGASAVLHWCCFALTAKDVPCLELWQWEWEAEAGSLLV